jgi:hypothetical protein
MNVFDQSVVLEVESKTNEVCAANGIYQQIRKYEEVTI